MNTDLHPRHLDSARSAILNRFLEHNTPPNGIAKFPAFFDLSNQYRGGYFVAALQQLANEGCIEIGTGRFIRLTRQGYEAARELER